MFGTEEMGTEEVLLFHKAASENGCHVEQTQEDIEFIDSLLWYKKRELFLNKESRRTASGNYRRDSGYMHFMDKGLDALVQSAQARNEASHAL